MASFRRFVERLEPANDREKLEPFSPDLGFHLVDHHPTRSVRRPEHESPSTRLVRLGTASNPGQERRAVRLADYREGHWSRSDEFEDYVGWFIDRGIRLRRAINAFLAVR